jgi:hypothetical protein
MDLFCLVGSGVVFMKSIFSLVLTSHQLNTFRSNLDERGSLSIFPRLI